VQRCKNNIKNNTDIFMFDIEPKHIGYSDDELSDTLFEFFLISKSQKNKNI
jgi:hypothetical protein